MAFKSTIASPYDDKPVDGAYINIRSISFERINKSGYIILEIWKDESTRRATGKVGIGIIQILLNSDKDMDNGAVESIDYNKIYGKTDTEIYKELKKHEVYFFKNKINLVEAEDLL